MVVERVRTGPQRRRFRWLAVIIASTTLVVGACGAAPASSGPAPASPAGASVAPASQPAPSQAGPAVDTSQLVTAMNTIGTGEWAPSRTGQDNKYVNALVHETLTRFDPETGQYVGKLAESFSVSPDGLTWTFKLRPNIPFQDDWGTVTADDVKYSWEQMIAEDSNHAQRANMSLIVGDDINNFKIINDLEFSVTGKVPFSALPSFLSDQTQGLAITSRRYHEEQGAAADTHPIGTGPWKFVSQTTGAELVLDKAFDSHWFNTPQFDRLIVKEVPDGPARLAGVQSGAYDIAALDMGLLKEVGDLKIISIPNSSNIYVILGGQYWGDDTKLDRDAPWIQADAPEKGKAIREAMSLAIDRQVILDRLLFDEGKLTTGILFQNPGNPQLSDPAWKVPATDLELAKQKLAEGGYPNGFPINLYYYPRYLDLPAITEAVAGMWEQIGITVTREQGDNGLLSERLDNYDSKGLVWLKLTGLKGEPVSIAANYRKGAPTSNGFFHPAIDSRYDAMLQEFDFDKRMAIAREIMTELQDEMVGIPLFTVNLPFVVGPKVGGWTPIPNLDDLSNLDTVTPAN